MNLKSLHPLHLIGLSLVLLLAAILVPYMLFGQSLENWSERLLQRSEDIPTASMIIVVLLAADIFLPLPSSLISTAAGAQLGFRIGVLAVFTGLTVGHTIGYAIGRFGGRPALRNLLGAKAIPGSAVLNSTSGVAAVATTRAVPVLAEAVCFACGAAEMPFRRFLISAASANLGLALAYSSFGTLSSQSGSFLLLFAASVLVPIAGFGIWRVVSR